MEKIIEQYKGEKSSVIQALQDTQKVYGYISKDKLKLISANVGVPYSYTYAIATFYKAFALQERGKYIIKVCDGTACHLQLSEDIIDEIKQYLGVDVGNTTADKLFTLEQVNCLGACAMAPVISINESLYGKLTRKKVREIFEQIKRDNGAVLPETPADVHIEAKKKDIPPQEEVSTVTVEGPPVSRAELSLVLGNFFTFVKKVIDKLGEIIDYVLEGK